jgi:hypothetical protein
MLGWSSSVQVCLMVLVRSNEHDHEQRERWTEQDGVGTFGQLRFAAKIPRILLFCGLDHSIRFLAKHGRSPASCVVKLLVSRWWRAGRGGRGRGTRPTV